LLKNSDFVVAAIKTRGPPRTVSLIHYRTQARNDPWSRSTTEKKPPACAQ